MKRIIIIILIIAFFGGGAFCFLSGRPPSTQITNYPSSGKNIIAFGDSLTFGYGSNDGKGYVDDLESLIGANIINEGVNGDTTEDALSRIGDVLNKDPKVVLVLLGGNDFLKQIPIETTFKNLGEIIQKIQDKGAIVVLLGVQGGILGDKYKSNFESLAKQYHTAYVPNVLDGIIGHSNLMSDPIHPNDEGYQLIAEKVLPVLQSVVK